MLSHKSFKQISHIFLDKCGIDDDEFATVLEGMQKMTTLEILNYKNNVFGVNSLLAI